MPVLECIASSPREQALQLCTNAGNLRRQILRVLRA
jgi:hypothetical protein